MSGTQAMAGTQRESNPPNPPALIPRTPSARWSLPSRYAVQTILGTGAYGTVCEAYDCQRDRFVAIKQVRHLFRSLTDAKRTLRELAILNACAHDHVVRVHDVCIPDVEEFSEIYIAMEVCDSDMKKLIYTDVTISEPMIQHLMYNTLVGLKYLHSAGVYHRDLKPANILINRDCSAKICDFNLARAMGATPQHFIEQDESPSLPAGVPTPLVPSTLRQRALTGHVVTRYYRAPEVLLLQASYNEAIDVWSLGCIFGELLQVLEGGIPLEDRGPLFPGSFSLRTPRRPERRGREMLDVIFECLGKPDEAQILGFVRSHVSLDHEYVRQYIRNLPQRSGTGLRRRLPFVEDTAMGLLERMLCLNPIGRVAVDDALEHSFLEDVRDLELEITAPTPIELDFETEGHLDGARLRKLFREQARQFQHGSQ